MGALEGEAQDGTEMMVEPGASVVVVSLTVTGGPQDPAPSRPRKAALNWELFFLARQTAPNGRPLLCN